MDGSRFHKVICERCELRWGTLDRLRTDTVQGRGDFGMGVSDAPDAMPTTLVLVATPEDVTTRIQEAWIEVEGRVMARDRLTPYGEPMRVQTTIRPGGGG
jgi:hypothetical protein